jgi:hypothetical protein
MEGIKMQCRRCGSLNTKKNGYGYKHNYLTFFCKDCKKGFSYSKRKLLLKSGKKQCTICGEIKPFKDFHKSKSGCGTLPHCKECAKLNPLRFKKYNITLFDYQQMLQDQNSLCKICRTILNSSFENRACIDHDHEKGKVRALLCPRCNTMIGLANDDVNVLNDAIQFLLYFKNK